MSKSGKTTSIQIHSQRRKACNQHIDPNIKFLPSNQQWICNIFLNDIILGLNIMTKIQNDFPTGLLEIDD